MSPTTARTLADSVAAWAISPDGRAVVAQVAPTVAVTLDPTDGAVLARYEAPEPIRALAWMGPRTVALVRDQNVDDLYLTTHPFDRDDPVGLADLPGLAGHPLWIMAPPDGLTLSVASASFWHARGTPAPRGGTVFFGADLARSERLYVPSMPIRLRDPGAMLSLAVLEGAPPHALVLLSDPEDNDLWVARHRRGTRQSVVSEVPVPTFGPSDVLRFRAFAVADGALVVTGWRRPLSVAFAAVIHANTEGARVLFGGVASPDGDHAITALSVSPRGDAALVQQDDLHALATRVTHLDLVRGVATTLLDTPDLAHEACAACFAPDGAIDTLRGASLARQQTRDGPAVPRGEFPGVTARSTLHACAGGWLVATERDDGGFTLRGRAYDAT